MAGGTISPLDDSELEDGSGLGSNTEGLELDRDEDDEELDRDEDDDDDELGIAISTARIHTSSTMVILDMNLVDFNICYPIYDHIFITIYSNTRRVAQALTIIGPVAKAIIYCECDSTDSNRDN